MLKRKLLRSGLFANGLLVILAAVHATGTQQSFGGSQQAITDSTMQWLTLDEELLQFSGLTATIAEDAPRIKLNKEAARFTKTYIVDNSEMLEKVKQRSPDFFRIMDTVFSRYKLPIELKHLAIVESQLNTTARSRVGAVGTWQLMATTARLLKLKVTSRYDERKHLYKSTVAAAKYLRDLHGLFDDWLLTIAAYNCGPAPVYAAIRKSGSRNFWKLQYFLPKETRGHVKKFISTHYYFEGQGSITTVTKQEAHIYRKTMLAFAEKHNRLLKEKQMADAATVITDTICVEDKIVAKVNLVAEK